MCRQPDPRAVRKTSGQQAQTSHKTECSFDINIVSEGDIHIYNCGSASGAGTRGASPPLVECPTDPIAPGQCVPLAIGAKPKQSQRQKLDRLLASTRVPSSLGASFFHVARRFIAGKEPGNALEADTFAVLRELAPDVQGILSCAVTSFDSLSQAERDSLFDASLPADLDAPLDAAALGASLARELTQQVGVLVFDDPAGTETERPGLNRFFDPGSDDVFQTQLRICSVNGIRTSDFLPLLGPGDFLPSELQRECQTVVDSAGPRLDCRVKQGNCPGNFLQDQTCLRVPEVEAGLAVVLQGVNFMSVDATVRMFAEPAGTLAREVDAHVVGDIETLLTEVIDGQEVTIRDCRVHDRLTFRVPADLPVGVYRIQVTLPNTTGFPQFGEFVFSGAQYIQVVPPSSARFEISSEKLRARRETSPASFGSDEVRVRVRSYPITASFTELILGAEQAFDSVKFGNMDSGDTRDMVGVWFRNQQPIAAMAMTVFGFEIDSESAYQQQIDSFTDAFYSYLKIAVAAAAGAIGGGALGLGVKDLVALGLKHWLVLAIAAAVALVVMVFLALWAPADLIIEDKLGFTSVDLAMLTGASFPPPAPTQYKTGGGIRVTVTPLEKIPTQYRERREYFSEDEDSIYEIELRYNRLA